MLKISINLSESMQENKESTCFRHPNQEVYIDEVGFDFTSFSNKTEVTLGKYDPATQYLTVANGMNLKGRCDNKNCPSFKAQVSWIRKGYGTYNMDKERYGNKCQSCKYPIKGATIKSIGYTQAKLSITGVKLQGQNEVEINMNFLSKEPGKFSYFNDIDEDIAKWGFLQIKVQKA